MTPDQHHDQLTDDTNSNIIRKQKTALILGGGGARAAYQVGVLKAIGELLPNDCKNPFPIICGTSAGSINAVALAANASNFKIGIKKIIEVWSNFELNHVFYIDTKHLLGRMIRWMWDNIGFGNWRKGPGSILNNQPLHNLLNHHINFNKIDQAFASGDLHAYCLTACSYNTGESTTFYDGADDIQEWSRNYRRGKRQKMEINHLMASSAIPVIFESIKIGNEYFGDGSIRQTSPLSPAIHLGADRLLIIGLRKESDLELEESPEHRPSLIQTIGYVLDTVFLNSLQSDVERLERLNCLLKKTENNTKADFKVIEHLIINPSQDIANIAKKYYPTLPWLFRFTLTFLGMNKGNSRRFVSYLMFTKSFCEELIELGYQDAMQQKEDITSFLKPY